MFAYSDLELTEAQDWSFPVPIAYGPGRLAEVGQQCIDLGVSNPLIVTDRGSHGLPFIARLQQILVDSGLNSGLFFGISPNPRDDEISAGCESFNSGRHDAVIAIGGGSAMDGGKSICLTATSGVDLWDFEFEQTVSQVKQPFPKLITIPTTAGTGAETESTAMVTHTEKAMKFCVWHPDCHPALALLDPELTLALPRNLSAWTGADAMTHAIEAYLVPGFHPLCDGLALQGLALISKCLPLVVREPDNLAARGGMLAGSCLAGIAFSKGLGMVHAISHMVGAEFNTQHGLTNAIILPVVLRFNETEIHSKIKPLCQAMNLPAESADSLFKAINRILDDIEIPRCLADIGVPEDCALRIAEKAIQDSAAATNPRQASIEEIEALILQAIRQAR